MVSLHSGSADRSENLTNKVVFYNLKNVRYIVELIFPIFVDV